MVMLVWIGFGLIAGLLASRLSQRARNLALDIALGIAGAFGGGFAMQSLGFPQPTAFLVAGIFGAAAGAVAMLAGYRSIFRET